MGRRADDAAGSTPMPPQLLTACVQAVEDDTGNAVRAIWRELAGSDLPAGAWSEVLYEALSRNEIAFQLSELLGSPRPLHELPGELEQRLGRHVNEAEVLTWLTLGAAARKEGRPLLRPVVHGFVRGISGAVVSFPAGSPSPRLWLAAEDEIEAGGGEAPARTFPGGDLHDLRTALFRGVSQGLRLLRERAGRRGGGGRFLVLGAARGRSGRKARRPA